MPSIPFSRRRQWAARQPISFLMEQAVQNPGVISLAAGLVDPASLPVAELRAICGELLANDAEARQALQYGTTPGAERLRQHLVRHLSQLEGLTPEESGITPGQILLTTGSQQFLSLVGEMLIDPGDIVLVSAPTYFAFLGTLNGLAARIVAIPSDDDGMRTDALQAELKRLAVTGELERVKLIYLVSDFENPSGLSLSAERRREVVEIAKFWSQSHRILILEDAAYRELRYEGAMNPSVWSFDTERDTVILTQTFSKTFSPGLRVGYGLGPQEIMQALSDRKGNEDFGSSNFGQHLFAHVFEQNLYASHVTQVQAAYRAKRDAVLNALDREFAGRDDVHWVRPHGGLYVWLTLPRTMQTGFDSPLFVAAVREGMMYVPGEFCYVGPLEQRPQNQMRLSFGVMDPAGLTEAIARLARAVRTVAADSSVCPSVSLAP